MTATVRLHTRHMSALGQKVKSGHFAVRSRCPLYPQKRTLGGAHHRAKSAIACSGVTAIMCSRLVFLLLGSASADKTWSLMIYGA
jgi:hypothetical protein